MTMRRRVGFLFIIGAAVSLAAVSTAWACGVLATLTLNAKKAAPGQTVTATGKNYGQVSQGNSEVTIRWKDRQGAALATAVPDARGRISASFQVPAGAARGSYVVMATQTNPTGAPKAGTPGRTTLRVREGSAQGATAAPWSSAKPSGPGGSEAAVALDGGGSGSPAVFPTLLGVALSLTLLGTGLTLVARSRTANRPQLGA